MNITIRQGRPDDAEQLIEFDQIAQIDPGRIELIRRTIAAGTCHVAEAAGQLVGYAVLDYSFYDNGMIEMLYVHPDHRHRGIGFALVGYVESLCQTAKLFTSTNLSNLQMQSLLAKHGYVITGFVGNLDEADPEVVYFKRLREDAG